MIFAENLFDNVKDVEKAKRKMRLYQHRYKDSLGPEANKQRVP
jgi:hypothetical protein